MELQDFARYIRDKSMSKLLHRTRKESLKRIVAHEDLSPVPRKK